MYEYDKKIIELIELMIKEKIISSMVEFCNEIKILRQTIYKIKKGLNHFTALQVETICKKYNVNANWIFGSEKNIFNIQKTTINKGVEQD